MVLFVEIDDQTCTARDGMMRPIEVRCGAGFNTVKWLALTVSQRYARMARSEGRPHA